MFILHGITLAIIQTKFSSMQLFVQTRSCAYEHKWVDVQEARCKKMTRIREMQRYKCEITLIINS